MRLLYLILFIFLLVLAGYVLDILATAFGFMWNTFNTVNITKIDLGVDFKNNIYAPLVAVSVSLITFLTIIIIGTSIVEKKRGLR